MKRGEAGEGLQFPSLEDLKHMVDKHVPWLGLPEARDVSVAF